MTQEFLCLISPVEQFLLHMAPSLSWPLRLELLLLEVYSFMDCRELHLGAMDIAQTLTAIAGKDILRFKLRIVLV